MAALQNVFHVEKDSEAAALYCAVCQNRVSSDFLVHPCTVPLFFMRVVLDGGIVAGPVTEDLCIYRKNLLWWELLPEER